MRPKDFMSWDPVPLSHNAPDQPSTGALTTRWGQWDLMVHLYIGHMEQGEYWWTPPGSRTFWIENGPMKLSLAEFKRRRGQISFVDGKKTFFFGLTATPARAGDVDEVQGDVGQWTMRI